MAEASTHTDSLLGFASYAKAIAAIKDESFDIVSAETTHSSSSTVDSIEHYKFIYSFK